MTNDEIKKLVETSNEVYEQTMALEHFYIPMKNLPPINIKFGDNQFTTVDYWWEGNDFVFVTDKETEYRCNNAYPTSIKIGDLSIDNDEITLIMNTTKYEKQ